MNNRVMFSSAKDDWATPQEFFDLLDEDYNFTLDPCALPHNAKCKKFYTQEDNGLAQNWEGEIVFCNPPYGRSIADWVRKCSEEAKKPNTTVVALLPARTDTRYFHDYIYNRVKKIIFIRGRLKFGGCKNSAPFPSMVVEF